ncbi:efflux RND transporter periplasmic adaptor subunit [Gottfriedia luciferensis]|uniref:efflux RND transporter periplasmic adaptor subunit n=1 Tax=Gottfriedia luciferensis TaxID=178774 RepID=UPI000B43A3C9|nr:efflux RND transporter periplasmic adaptor subunit [Gottfriedia luciferensis]
MKKWIIGILLFVICIGAGGYFYLKPSAQETTSFTRTGVAQKGTLEVNVSGSGSIEAINSKDLLSETNAEVDEVLVSVNQKVKKGDELVSFTDGSDSIVAPFSGTITSLSVAAGNRVNQGTVVAHITDYNNLQTTIGVDELDISKVKVGQTVNIDVSAFPGTKYTGKVSDVAREGEVTNGVSTFNVNVKLNNITNLKVGMTTESSILVQKKENVVYVPVEAINTRNNVKYVIVNSSSSNSDKSTTNTVEVKTGLTNENYVEITSGIEAGQEVVLPQIQSSNSNRFGQGGFQFGGGGNFSGREMGGERMMIRNGNGGGNK